MYSLRPGVSYDPACTCTCAPYLFPMVVIRITRCFLGGFVCATAGLSGSELGDGLRALRHGVLGQLPRQDEAHRRLDLTRGHRGLLVVASQLGGLGGNLLEDVVDERVQDGHGLGADACVGVHLRGKGEGQPTELLYGA